MLVNIDRSTMRSLARNLRVRTGDDVPYTRILDDVASALGWKTDALMHALKAEEKAGGAAVVPPAPLHAPDEGATRREIAGRGGSGAIARWLDLQGVDADSFDDGFLPGARARVERAFALQLGKPWTGIRSAAPVVQALLAAFVLRIARRAKSPHGLASEVRFDMDIETALQPNVSAKERSERLVLLAEDVFRDEMAVFSELERSMAGHAWAATATIAAVEHLRSRRGLVAAASFSWLRYADPVLLRIVSSVGRRIFPVEAAGAIAHHREEKASGKFIREPAVSKAVEALEREAKILFADGSGETPGVVPGGYLQLGPDHSLEVRSPRMEDVEAAVREGYAMEAGPEIRTFPEQ